MKRLISTVNIIVVVALTISICSAQSSPDALVKQFFNTYESEGSTAALDQLYDTNPWMSKAADAVQNLKNQMEGLTLDFVGEYHGYDEITTKSLSSSYVLKSYLVRYDRQPLRFTFQFYKPNDTWRLYSFEYDGALDDEVEEAARLYFLLNQD